MLELSPLVAGGGVRNPGPAGMMHSLARQLVVAI